jgi:tripartite-type tricarboxylate transporter receptor subunit TctC
VENKGGASGSIALLQTIRAPADGYRLVIAVPDSVTIYPLLKKTKPYVAEKDLTPIAQVAEAHFVFAVSATSHVNNLAEFITRAKARSESTQLSYASPGNGTSARLVTEMLMARSGVKMLHVPYKGDTPALTDLLAGQVNVMFGNLGATSNYIKSGKLKILAMTTAKRVKSFPNVPLIQDDVPGMVAYTWFAMVAPPKTPIEITKKISVKLKHSLTCDVSSCIIGAISLSM